MDDLMARTMVEKLRIMDSGRFYAEIVSTNGKNL
jgi:hypothetical protein